MQTLYSLLIAIIATIAVTFIFYRISNKTAGQLASLIIKETVKEDVEPIFNWYGKLTSVHRTKVFKDIGIGRDDEFVVNKDS